MVVKAVPPAMTTVVGVPGRLVEPTDRTNGFIAKRSRKDGIDAYGVTSDAPDPVAHAINCMLDHIHVMDKRMEEMCNSLRKLSEEQPDMELRSALL